MHGNSITWCAYGTRPGAGLERVGSDTPVTAEFTAWIASIVRVYLAVPR